VVLLVVLALVAIFLLAGILGKPVRKRLQQRRQQKVAFAAAARARNARAAARRGADLEAALQVSLQDEEMLCRAYRELTSRRLSARRQLRPYDEGPSRVSSAALPLARVHAGATNTQRSAVSPRATSTSTLPTPHVRFLHNARFGLACFLFSSRAWKDEAAGRPPRCCGFGRG
jgi:hypothetical protein